MTQLQGRFAIARVLVLAALIAPGARASAVDVELPRPTAMVTDSAGVLLPAEVVQLEAKLQRLRESGLVEAIVYLAPSLPDDAVLEELTLRAVNEWGIGDASTDNGLAIFAFMNDRKVRIEVGLGLEGRISNDAAAAIIQEQIAPAFREKEYAEGLNAAIDKVEGLLRSESRQEPRATMSAPASSDDAEYVDTALGRTRRIAGPMNAPRVTRRVFPRFPGEARRAGTQGIVELAVLIDTTGKVRTVTVTKGLPNGLSEAAADAVKQWTFEPVIDGAAPVPALFDVVISFKL